jgi:prepilin-type N-terminal cleavage/methylation domain-containing protein
MKRGFTLVELIIYIAILSVVLLGIVSTMYLVFSARSKAYAVNEVEEQGALIMESMARTIRSADAINSPAIASSSSTLSVATYDLTKNPTVFDLNANQIRIKEGAASAVVLNNSRLTVSNLLFTNVSRSGTAGVIKIEFTLSYANPGNAKEFNYSKTFYSSVALR